MRRVYLDHNATTPVAPEVFEAMKPFLLEDYGNASSVHWFGQRAKSAIEYAREQVATLIGARSNDVSFTSGGTEADNLSLFGAVDAARTKDGTKHVITTTIEHHAVLHTVQALERRGIEVTCVRVGPCGIVNVEDVRKTIRPNTVLISIMHANNELGTIQPLEEIGRVAKEHGITFHTDAVQSVGKIPVDVEKLGVDLLSLSAHKIYGPKGVGALFVRRGTRLTPHLFGGHHERGRRPGTENTPGIVGLGKAAEIARARLDEDSERIGGLRDRLEKFILSKISLTARNGTAAPRVPNTANIRFDHVEGDGFLISLDLKGIACSAGSACSSGSVEPSHVLTAIGLSHANARGCIRFSLGRGTTAEDIDYATGILPEIVERLRSLSTQSKTAATSLK